jgi:hypothetical protein
MRHNSTRTVSPRAARPKFARFSAAIPEFLRLVGHDDLPAKPKSCVANPVFGHASPIMGQRRNANASSIATKGLPSEVQSRAHVVDIDEAQLRNASLGANKSLSSSGASPGRLNAFFAISVNSPRMSMVNFPCCVCSAPKPRVPGVTPKSSRSADTRGDSNGSWGRCLFMINR